MFRNAPSWSFYTLSSETLRPTADTFTVWMLSTRIQSTFYTNTIPITRPPTFQTISFRKLFTIMSTISFRTSSVRRTSISRNTSWNVFRHTVSTTVIWTWPKSRRMWTISWTWISPTYNADKSISFSRTPMSLTSLLFEAWTQLQIMTSTTDPNRTSLLYSTV